MPWSIATVSRPTTCSTCPSSTTCASTIASSSPTGETTSTHRELLEPSQAPSAPLQWHPKDAVPPLPQGMRMALQLPPRRPLARNLENLAQRNSLCPYLGQPLFLFESHVSY